MGNNPLKRPGWLRFTVTTKCVLVACVLAVATAAGKIPKDDAARMSGFLAAFITIDRVKQRFHNRSRHNAADEESH